ncbi:phosphatase PAP2 family protein [Aurantiacibacter gilvus]|uniref:Phosphatase PAP2 family protein n=1 Tax=Aurantiacibacter gilvus TaxID=3139141 RepID=A0ABU9IF29_9SPHN
MLAAIVQIALASVGVLGFRPLSYLSNAQLYLATIVVIVGGQILIALAILKPKSPLQLVRSKFVEDYQAKLKRGLLLVIALVVFMPAFSAMKSAIPLFNSYGWDATLIDLDRLIHGRDAWLILQPVFGYPFVTFLLAIAYHSWILLIYAGGVYFAVYEDNRALALRYFIAYFSIWILGGVCMAIGFASVGPCFASPILGIDTFEGQMTYLQAANTQYPVLVLDVQQRLLDWHFSGSHGLGRGITAMPSMHVALAFLFFLAMRHVSKWAGIAFGAFFVVILIGSVHLAYHYAVDGYVSIILTALIWKASGWVLRPAVA